MDYTIEQIEQAIRIAKEKKESAISIQHENEIDDEIEKLEIMRRKLYEDETI